LVAFAATAHWTREASMHQATRRFQSESDRWLGVLEARLQMVDQVLLGAAGVLGAEGRVDGARWRSYVAALELERSAPEIRALGAARFQGAAEPAGARRRGGSKDDGPRAVVLYEAGPAARAESVGADLMADAAQRDAVDRALQGASPALSAHLGGSGGAVRGSSAAVVMVRSTEPRAAGVVYAVVDVEVLVRRAFESFGRGMRLRVFDGTGLTSTSRMFDSLGMAGETAARADDPLVTRERTAAFGGHYWTLQFTTTKAFEEGIDANGIAIRVAGAGAAMAALILLALWRAAPAREREAPAPPREVAHAEATRNEASGAGVMRVARRILEGVLDHLHREAARSVGGAEGGAPPDRLIANVRGALKAIRSLLDDARGAGGRPEVLDLTDCVTSLRDVAPFAVSNRAALKFSLDDTLPPVETDPVRVRQILVHLLADASESIGERAGMILVRTGVARRGADDLDGLWPRERARPGTYVYIEVSDTGTGMDAGRLSRIFEAVDQGRVPERASGLAAALGLIRDLNGLADVTTRLERGTTVRILLPQSVPVSGAGDPPMSLAA
ncbi:MAG: CHASE domain-containing protein, partial [Myxococcales bacterium]|nr:CHASE domain-containing protein [Myxococcales bacterium]